MKAKPLRQPKASSQPYERSKQGRKRGSGSGATIKPPAQKLPATLQPIAIPSSSPASGTMLFRDLCMQSLRKRHPDYEPRNDWEVLYLGTMEFKCSNPSQLGTLLSTTYAEHVEAFGVGEVELSLKLLDTYVEPTGIKPRPNDGTKFVYTRPIPDSQYSIRLFPGSLSAAEYCMDFVDTATGEPVNSPFEYELFAVPELDTPTPWLQFQLGGKLRSIERARGIKPEDIRPGEEKFVLRDGMNCVLTRPSKVDILFTVPIRPRSDMEQMPNHIRLDFPKFAN